MIGIVGPRGPQHVVSYNPNPFQAVWHGVERTQFIITSTLGYLGDFVMRAATWRSAGRTGPDR